MRKVLHDITIIAVAVATVWYVYVTYGEQISLFLFGETDQTIYIDDLAISVSIADEPEEWQQGLSGVTELRELEGKLFIFPQEDRYSMWMRDMNLSLDIIWINDVFEIVHIEERVSPDTFPESFVSAEPARFVLEVNAFFTETFKLQVGDRVTLPPSIIPPDIVPEA